VKVPPTYGLQPIDAIAKLAEVGLSGAVLEEPIPSSAPLGTVAGTSPRSGATALSGSTVTIYLSSGVPPARPDPTPTASSPTPLPSGNGGSTGNPSPTPSATTAPAAATPTPKPGNTKKP
jgi:beta-lactam-binding protein with PASTA domain